MYRTFLLSISFSLTLLIFSACGGGEGRQAANNGAAVQSGAEVLISEKLDLLEGRRVGLVTNHSAVVGDDHLIDLLDEAGIEITALFGPEHGIRGDADAGEKIDNSIDEKTGAPIYSLYGQNRKPTAEMLENVDILMYDIQDIGARFYTYISTLGYAMQAAAENNIPFVVLDRPNPLGGELVEGFVREPEYESFVGLYPIPVVHGLTVGELAKMIKGESMLDNLDGLKLRVIEMKNWRRNMLWPETGLSWIPPSPNIPEFETALIYPGACFFEGTRASEGRGTMDPFILLGAPWADSTALAEELNKENLSGLKFEAASFTPQSIKEMDSDPKWQGEALGGIRYKITNPQSVKPVAAGVYVLKAFYNSTPESERDDFFSPSRLNRLAGTDRLFTMIRQGSSAPEIIASWNEEVEKFKQERAEYLLYD